MAPGGSAGLVAAPETNLVRLNVGAGDKQFPGWISVDLAPNADIVSDVCAIPLPDGYADEIMAIHLIEHIERWRVQTALREWFRLLKPRGMLILELPDIVKCCKNIVAGMPEQEGMLGVFGDPSLRNPRMMHAWGWTESTMKAELVAAGFSKVKARSPQFHGRRDHRDMRIEARKPGGKVKNG